MQTLQARAASYKRYGISNKSTISITSTFKDDTFRFDDLSMSKDEILRNLQDGISSPLLEDVKLYDFKLVVYWIDTQEMFEVRSNNKHFWSNPEYGWKYDNVRPKKLLFEMEYLFDIGYVFDLRALLVDIFNDKYPRFLINEIHSFIPMEKNAFQFKFSYSFCSQAFNRNDMGFEYGYFHSNNYKFQYINDDIPISHGVILKNVWSKQRFRALLLSMLGNGYKIVKQCAQISNYAKIIKEYTPYHNNHPDLIHNIKLFADDLSDYFRQFFDSRIWFKLENIHPILTKLDSAIRKTKKRITKKSASQ